MQKGDATLFTLSLLTSDAFAFVYAGVVLRQHFCGAFCVGFGLTIAGVLVFTSSQLPTLHLSQRRADGASEPLACSAALDAERSYLGDRSDSAMPRLPSAASRANFPGSKTTPSNA